MGCSSDNSTSFNYPIGDQYVSSVLDTNVCLAFVGKSFYLSTVNINVTLRSNQNMILSCYNRNQF